MRPPPPAKISRRDTSVLFLSGMAQIPQIRPGKTMAWDGQDVNWLPGDGARSFLTNSFA
jgi:hypothetical protein